MVGVLAAAGCSRPVEPPKVYTAAETHSYLQKLGQIRALINADNKDRIPGMIRGRDIATLSAQAAKIEGYMGSVAALPTNGVDPDVMKFTQNFEAILDAYKSVCLDSAELFREMKTANVQPPAPGGPLSDIKFWSASGPTDAIGAVDALLKSMDRMDTSAKAAVVFLQPIINRVSDDADKLRTTKDAHHEFTKKAKAELAQRYPGFDWTSKEILP
jgi:hypothetical protein